MINDDFDDEIEHETTAGGHTATIFKSFKPSKALSINFERLTRYMHDHGFDKGYFSFNSHGDGFELNRFCMAKEGSLIDPWTQSTLNDHLLIAPNLSLTNLSESIFECLAESVLDKIDNGESHQEVELNLVSQLLDNGQRKWSLTVDYSEEMESSEDHCHEHEAEAYEDNTAHALLIKFMKEHELDQFHFTFSGGGDSGELNELECELSREDREAKNIPLESGEKVSFSELAYSFCNKEATAVGNWWDNEGGRGAIFVYADGRVNIDVSFHERSTDFVFQGQHIELAFPLKTGKKLTIPKIEKGLES
jgi:hypothetical protein